MADKENQQAPNQKVGGGPDCLQVGNESPPPEDVTGEKTCDSQDGPKQWDYFPWDRWSRERSTDSRERSVDSRDSATRERDLRYAEERKRDRERGRREEVILYRHRDSETTQSDSTEEEDAESSNGSKVKAPTSTTVNESAENKRTFSKEAVPVPLGHTERTEHALAKHTHQKAAKTSKSPPTKATEGSTFVANKRNGNADQKGSGDSHSKTSRNGNKGPPIKEARHAVSDKSSDSETDHARHIGHERRKERRRDANADHKRVDSERRRSDDAHDHQRDTDHQRRQDRGHDRRRKHDRNRDRDRKENHEQGWRGDQHRRDDHKHNRREGRSESHRDENSRRDDHRSDRDRNQRDEQKDHHRDDRRDEQREDRRGDSRGDRRRNDRREDRKGDNRDDEQLGDFRTDRSGREEPVGQKRVRKSSPDAEAPPRKKDVITGRTGGAYIPPARLRMMQQQITDKSSAEYQRIAWEALKKSINGLVNKANVGNIDVIIKELMRENLVRGRGLLCRTIMTAQAASPTFTHVYAAMVAVINTRFPQTGELILKRLVIQFRRSFRRNDKLTCMASVRFIAHLLNQQVAHEVLALEILTLLLGNSTDDSVEVAVAFLKECGMKLTELTPKGVHAIFERLRSILHEASLDKRVQYMIEVMFAIRKDGFSAHPSVVKELELVEEESQYTHLLALDDTLDGEDMLNVFKFDPEFIENEERYAEIAKDILGSDDEDEGSGGDDSNDEEEEEEEQAGENGEIIDNTETNLVALRRTIYLTIQSSLNFEECAHKLLKLELKPGQVGEMCHMILDCCAQQRTYEKFFGLLAQRFCQLKKDYAEPFEQIFLSSYDTIHRFETNKLRNVAKFFSHLLFTDAIPWNVLSHIKLTEDDTTSSSRIFIKILFQELCEYMGLPKLNERIKDPTLQDAFEGLFPRDLPKNTRFAINFFTSIGLGGLTADLREHLKSAPKPAPVPDLIAAPPAVSAKKSASSSSDSTSNSSSSDSSSDSDSESSS
nr:pre-mRNA-splicing factor CWC22 homolog isoform X2 [Rhipicephalus microplus]